MTQTPPPSGAPSDQFREQLLDAMLEIAAETGWTDAGLARAADKAGLTDGQVQLATPNGISDLLDALAARAARGAAARLGQPDVAAMKVREKVTTAVRAYLAFLEPHKAAVKRAAASPANLLTGPKGMWAAADAIWAGLGDKSTDYNWYTKRMILSGVIGSTLVAWLGTDDPAQVDAFLARRIENVMQFEKFKGQVIEAFSKMPDPFDLMGKPRP
ncbi:MAG TPA: COQ9 family protein [Hyphomonadaceae bacterium]|nr:COQ9 family protein [Hyphomonadaceae bacterium]